MICHLDCSCFVGVKLSSQTCNCMTLSMPNLIIILNKLIRLLMNYGIERTWHSVQDEWKQALTFTSVSMFCFFWKSFFTLQV